MQPSRLLPLASLLAALVLPAALSAADTAPPPVVEGHLRREPVLPAVLPDYELRVLDQKKEIVFHIGNQTVVGEIPILVYVPVTHAGRAAAVDRLAEARKLLINAAAGSQVSTNDLAALRDLIEQALGDLREAPIPVATTASK